MRPGGMGRVRGAPLTRGGSLRENFLRSRFWLSRSRFRRVAVASVKQTSLQSSSRDRLTRGSTLHLRLSCCPRVKLTTSQPVGAQNFLLGGCAAGVHLRAPPEHARRLAHGTCSLHSCRVDGLRLIEVKTAGEQHAVLSELDASAAGSSATWRMATTERSSPRWHASAHRWAAALYGSCRLPSGSWRAPERRTAA